MLMKHDIIILFLMLVVTQTTIQPIQSQNPAPASNHTPNDLPPDLDTHDALDAQANLSVPPAPAVTHEQMAQLLTTSVLRQRLTIIQRSCQHKRTTR